MDNTQEVPVVRLTIKPHPNADRIEIAEVAGYQSIVKKGQFKTGDLAAYIPEQSVVPDCTIEELGLTGRLAGSKKNRVKIVRLRGIYSQGLIYPAREGWKEGQDVANELGIVKWVPAPPRSLHGRTVNMRKVKRPSVATNATLNHKTLQLQRYPKLLEGKDVVVTEKVHGTFCGLTLLPEHCAIPGVGRIVTFSKGLGAAGHFYPLNDAKNSGVAYVKIAKQYERQIRLLEQTEHYDPDRPIMLLGEIYGVQDLKYSATNELDFRAFDVFIGKHSPKPTALERFVRRFPKASQWLGLQALAWRLALRREAPSEPTGYHLDYDDMLATCAQVGIPTVPELYRGPYDYEAVKALAEGNETVSGNELHIREGVVVKPLKDERGHAGRYNLKYVSPTYKLRGGGTEYN